MLNTLSFSTTSLLGMLLNAMGGSHNLDGLFIIVMNENYHNNQEELHTLH